MDERSEVSPQDEAPSLMWQFLRAFIWLDRNLQQRLGDLGWPQATRSESQVMLLAVAGIVRPTEISKMLGLSRQAVNQTLSNLVDKGLVALTDDPSDRRCKIVALAEGGGMRSDARNALRDLETVLESRIGGGFARALRQADDSVWDPPSGCA